MSEWRLTRRFDFQGRTVRYDVRGIQRGRCKNKNGAEWLNSIDPLVS